MIFFLADAKANGAGAATANATPIVGDLLGIKQDIREFYEDLAADVATAEQLLNADVAHGHTQAQEAFSRFVAYELGERSCEVFDQGKLTESLDTFYNELFFEYRNEIRVTVQTRGLGLAFPVTVDRTRVGTANINPIVQRFQGNLNKATLPRP